MDLARTKNTFLNHRLFFLATTDMLHADFHNKEAIVCQGEGVELFDSVIAKQIEDISEDISDQLTAYLSIKVYLRITVD